MKLNPNATSFVPTWSSAPPAPPPPPPMTADPQYTSEWDSANGGGWADDDGADFCDDAEVDELLAEIERVQMEEELSREYNELKAQGKTEEAELWSRWMVSPPSPLSPPAPRQHKKHTHHPQPSQYGKQPYHNSYKSRSGPLYNPRGTYAPHNPVTASVPFQ
ncbi:hypothetical protein SPRG_13170 [Saprolegnia parasitica CBS 223.65]|uniref:Ataxin-2 C-terminal domain-containing protein n=1 Tax=Saprolegnia parasitica (strain CBS 223.65) TaxID=695850 RepID=A0A067BY41_SAPPC|nr:hypothetical protein SPRG_13170 [Saprolegnia parasitica CBS 223.65]KDO21755.1 hypothetical protein SPRG_13170 [Saprolegnia parasitica CBS 223.65]|eukprot:XP_012207556.1 hypothetical protein SPRG_13170 [Saprolegnia parasitica CBS 223.65]